MADSERTAGPGKDLLGLALFIPGAFVTVLVLLDLLRPGGQGETARLAGAIVSASGFLPGLVLALGVLGLGIAHYLSPTGLPLSRHLVGVVGLALGLAVLLGAVVEGGGGAIGDRLGGDLARGLHEIVGVVLGLSIALSGAWFAWLRGSLLLGEIWKSAPTLAPRSPEEEGDGVTTAEAAALVPDEKLVAYMEQVWKQARASSFPRQVPPSPYPEDVRRKGLVPDGARVIPSDAPAPSRRPTEALEPTAEPADHDADHEGAGGHATLSRDTLPAGEDLAAAPRLDQRPAVRPGGGTRPPGRPAAQPPPGELGLDPAAPKAPLGYRSFFDQPPEHADATQEPAGSDSRPAPSTPAAPKIGRAISVPSGARAIPSRRSGPPAPTWELEEDALSVEQAAEPEAPADVHDGSGEDRESPAPDAEPEPRAALPLSDAEEDEAEHEAEHDVEDEPERNDPERSGHESSSDESEAEFQADREEAEDELSDDDSDTPEQLEDSAQADPEAEEEEPDGGEEPRGRLEADEPEVSSEGLLPEPRPEPAGAAVEQVEHEVVLEPQAGPPAKRTRKPPRTGRKRAPAAAPKAEQQASAQVALEGEELVRRCGLLFLEHGRVAVSLLQRSFGLDFDRACQVLDELQERGLIGPYLGGQRRDLLMSAEEWVERVG